MKLLFVFTGGTIGSTLRDTVISADTEKPYKILDCYRKRYGIDFDYVVAEPYIELSENNTGLHIKSLVSCIKENSDKDYDGIIVTHGTDTIQYSAAAIGYCLGVDSLPICIVASNAPIENETSNALDNLYGAVSFIKQKCGRGAFVVYRNANSDTVRVHRATRLIGPKAYSDDVSSVGGTVYGWFDGNFDFQKNDAYGESDDCINKLDVSDLRETNSFVMVINTYVGMVYPRIPEGIEYVMLNTYHSGTLNTKSQDALAFFDEARARNIKVYAMGISSGPQYSSTEAFSSLGITPIKDMSPISAYVKLWLICAMGDRPEKILQKSLCGDIVC